MSYLIHNANIKEWAKNYNGPLFDGILCDPPYELGFMGKSWDSTGIAFDSEMWADIYKLLKPGAHLLAFSGSRTYHRMAVAIEDAGFEIRDQLIWMYGSGFPKSLNIGKAVDRLNGVDIPKTKGFNVAGQGIGLNPNKELRSDHPNYVKPTSDNEWEGYGTALKPAHEPCVLARKPIEGTVANNVLKHGTGGLNIDGTRVGTEKIMINGGGEGIGWGRGEEINEERTGRFPANLIHDGSDEVEAVFPQTDKAGTGKQYNKDYDKTNSWKNTSAEIKVTSFGDSGSASRYFYTAKASKSERNAGLEGFEDRIAGGMAGTADQTLLTGSGNIRNNIAKNHHPTVKPLSLTKYLATLIKPPTGGRLLVPFSGSGSEMIGALQAGWEEVIGVELTEEYIPIAEARIKHWIKEPVQEKLAQEAENEAIDQFTYIYQMRKALKLLLAENKELKRKLNNKV